MGSVYSDILHFNGLFRSELNRTVKSHKSCKHLRIQDFFESESKPLNHLYKTLSGKINELPDTDVSCLKTKRIWRDFQAAVSESYTKSITEALNLSPFLDEIIEIEKSRSTHIAHKYDDDPMLKNILYGSDLVVVTNDYYIGRIISGEGLKQNEVNEFDFLLMKTFYKLIESGDSNIKIKGSEEFRNQTLACIKKLLTRASGRELIGSFLDEKTFRREIIIEEHPILSEAAIYCEVEGVNIPLSDSRIVLKDNVFYFVDPHSKSEKPIKKLNHFIKLSQLENKFFESSPQRFIRSRHVPKWLVLYHELTHIYHSENTPLLKSKGELGPLSSQLNTNAEEEQTIYGRHRANLPSMAEARWVPISENRLRTDFHMRPRIYHLALADVPYPIAIKYDIILKTNAFGDLIQMILDGELSPYEEISGLNLLCHSLYKGASKEFIETLLFFYDPKIKKLPEKIIKILKNEFSESQIRSLNELKKMVIIKGLEPLETLSNFRSALISYKDPIFFETYLDQPEGLEFEGSSSIWEVCSQSQWESAARLRIIKKLCMRGCSFDACGLNPFSIVLTTNFDLRQCKELLSLGADINGFDRSNGQTPLMFLINEMRAEQTSETKLLSIVEFLLENGANANLKDSQGATALHLAVNLGFPKVAERLIQAMSFEALESLSIFEKIYESNLLKQSDKLKLAAQLRAMGVNALENDVVKAFHVIENFLENSEFISAIDLLFRLPKEKLNTPFRNNFSFAQSIILNENITFFHKKHILKALHGRGFDLNTTFEEGITTINLAIDSGEISLIEELLKLSCCDVAGEKSAFLKVLEHDTFSEEEKLILLRKLIQHGFNINTVSTSKHTTPLFTAVNSGSMKITSFLLSNGANPNYQDELGYTPLLTLCSSTDIDSHKQLQLLDLLLAFNANIYATTFSGKNAFELALYNGNFELANKLLMYQPKFLYENLLSSPILTFLEDPTIDERTLLQILQFLMNHKDLDLEKVKRRGLSAHLALISHRNQRVRDLYYDFRVSKRGS